MDVAKLTLELQGLADYIKRQASANACLFIKLTQRFNLCSN